MIGTTQEMIDEARTWVGTPFVHQGRTKGRACDCLGLMIAVAKATGRCAQNFDERRYGDVVISKNMGIGIDEWMERIPKKEVRPGDWLWIAYGQKPTHLALVTERNTIIHARLAPGDKALVVEQRLPPQLFRRTRVVFRFRENANG